jgi:hypothetical protein
MLETFAWRDHPFTIDWPDEATSSEGRVVLEYHGVKSFESTQPQWHSTIRIGRPESDEARSAPEIATHTSGLEIRGSERFIYLWNGRSLGRIDPQSNQIDITLNPERHRIGTGLDVDLFLLVTFSLLSMLQARGHFVLHAAGVVSPRRTGVILVARSDSGKSTLTTALARAGWGYLSDDSLILRDEGRQVIASPFRRDFGLDPEADALFPGIGKHAETQLTDAAKWCIDPALAFPGERVEETVPRVIVIPSIVDRDESSITDVKPAEALIELLSQSSFLTFDRKATSAYMAVLKHLVSSCRCIALAGGRDLRDDPSRVIQLLEPALEEDVVQASEVP